MTSPKPSSAPTAVTTAATPRKRRRRAVATGAAEDCFTCRQRQAKCDRRRPYCTQCIDMGKECSGYRTTLTWGVGVASRGKLRGMSCPVPKSPSSTAQTSTQTNARKPSSVALPSPPTSTVSRKQPLQQTYAQPGQKSPSPIHSPTGQDYYASVDAMSPVHIPPPAVPYQGWHLPSFGEHMESFGGAGRKSRPQLPPKPLQRLHTTTLAAPYDDSAPSTSTGPLSSHSDSALGDYPSPSDFPGTPDDFHFADPIMHSYPEHLLPSRTPISSTESLVFPDAPRSFPIMYEDLSSSISSDQSLHELHDMSSMQPQQPYSQHPGYQDTFFPSALGAAAGSNLTHISDSSYSRGTRPTTHARTESSGRSSEAAAALAELAMVGTRSAFSADRHLSPRMQVLMDYYDRMICPALVAYDGPSNPYRVHVVGLAMESQALRNAIAALAVNNIRMRQNSEAKFIALSKSRWSGHSREWTQQRLSSEEIREMHGEPSDEERYYKATSIQLLNQQLADPRSAQEDSVLATLLVLCLFHVSDSGLSKFRTQLEGVKRLLSLREQRTSFTAWIEMFFTWFDVMTSTVNDRETQVRDDLLDAIAESSSLGALEHLVGCDGRLFKIIARLGRLNLLSQNRPVSPRFNTPSDNASQFDGNGWSTPTSHHHHHHMASNPLELPHDQRHEFWAEWRDIRQHLQQWELDPSAPNAPLCSATLPPLSTTSPHHHDLLHLSESFRYAALLYIERLAHPSLGSGALHFQNLVAQALFHISHMSPRSPVQKFLLWPLFITGTECVDAGHRAMVRAECVAIMRRSGFWNNLRGLEVLERVWSREDGESDGGRGGAAAASRRAPAAGAAPCKMEPGEDAHGQQAFRWRRAMERTDWEYMLV